MKLPTANYFFGYSRMSYIWATATTLYCLAAILLCGCSDISFFSLSAVNAAICSLMIFAIGSGPFSINKYINLFILIFFVLANGVQYASEVCTTSFSISFDRDSYLLFQGITTLCLLIYNGLYIVIYVKSDKGHGRSSDLNAVCVNKTALVILSTTSAIVIFAFCGFDISTMFSRGGWQQYADSSWMMGRQEVMLLFQRVIRPIPAYCLLIGILSGVGRRRIILLLLIAVVVSFPTGMPRSLAAAIWLSPLLIAAGRYLHRDAAMLLMILCLLVAFPLLDSFRYADKGREIEYGMRYFNTLNYDASQMAMAAVETDTVTHGRQLLGTIGFFVPRKVWADKPEGSGHLIAGIHGASYRNVSMPWFAEGYINFGWVGVVVFTLILAWISAITDIRFAWKKRPAKNNILTYGCYLILTASILFLMRGSLMASFSALVGNLLSYVLCCMGSTHRLRHVHA